MSATLDYQALRAMAECASSVRGKKFWLVIGDDGWRMQDVEPDRSPGETVIECENPPVTREGRVDYAEIGTGFTPRAGDPGEAKGKKVDLLNLYPKRIGKAVRADAVFWSESAVEKFLVPYYASVAGDQADRAVKALLDVFDPDRTPRDGAALNEDTEAFAIAHIPKSEYVTVGDEEPTVSTGLHVLGHSRATGEVVTVPLEAYWAPAAK